MNLTRKTSSNFAAWFPWGTRGGRGERGSPTDSTGCSLGKFSEAPALVGSRKVIKEPF